MGEAVEFIWRVAAILRKERERSRLEVGWELWALEGTGLQTHTQCCDSILLRSLFLFVFFIYVFYFCLSLKQSAWDLTEYMHFFLQPKLRAYSQRRKEAARACGTGAWGWKESWPECAGRIGERETWEGTSRLFDRTASLLNEKTLFLPFKSSKAKLLFQNELTKWCAIMRFYLFCGKCLSDNGVDRDGKGYYGKKSNLEKEKRDFSPYEGLRAMTLSHKSIFR